MISNGVVNSTPTIKDTPHMWNKLANGKEVSLRNEFKKDIVLTALEDSLLSAFDDVVINSQFPNCYFIVADNKIGVCKLDGTIVVPPVNGVPRKIKSMNGLRVGDVYSFEDIERYFMGRIGEKARGAGGSIAALLDEKTLEPIIPYGKYDYVIFTTKGMRQFFYVAKYDGNNYLWGCLDGNGEELVPCEYRSIALKNGKYVGDNSEDMFARLYRLREDINAYNQHMIESRYVFIERIGEFLSNVGNLIIKLDESLSQAGLYNSASDATMMSGNSIAAISPTTSSSSRNYQSLYDSWAHRAESHYNSITNLGHSSTDKKGNKKGSAGQGMSGGNYVAMKRSFREAQKQMRSIRQQAAKDGIQITQSKWETATISY